jgi:hypothetical protein
MTPNSASTSYCSAVDFFSFYARTIAADMLKPAPEFPRPSYLAMIDPANPAAQKLQIHLNRGAGEIEAACAIAKRYEPEDLNALTGVSQVLLHGINAARCMWSLYQTLKPGSARMEECPGAKESWELLEELRDGQLIFGFFETMDAGLPSVVQAAPAKLVTPNVVGYAQRLFPNYGLNRLINGNQQRFGSGG